MNWDWSTAATSSSFGCSNASLRGPPGSAGAGVDPTPQEPPSSRAFVPRAAWASWRDQGKTTRKLLSVCWVSGVLESR